MSGLVGNSGCNTRSLFFVISDHRPPQPPRPIGLPTDLPVGFHSYIPPSYSPYISLQILTPLCLFFYCTPLNMDARFLKIYFQNLFTNLFTNLSTAHSQNLFTNSSTNPFSKLIHQLIHMLFYSFTPLPIYSFTLLQSHHHIQYHSELYITIISVHHIQHNHHLQPYTTAT